MCFVEQKGLLCDDIFWYGHIAFPTTHKSFNYYWGLKKALKPTQISTKLSGLLDATHLLNININPFYYSQCFQFY